MGKNKKNKNQNRINLDDSDDDNISKTENTREVEQDITEIYESRKKNIFEELNNSDDEQNNNDTNITLTKNHDMNNLKSDKYFAQAYHEDDYENDYDKAIKLYKCSIENDSFYYKGVSAFNIALIYEDHYNDINSAEIYYKIASDKFNYSDAYTNLGLLYYNKKDYNNAYTYLHITITKHHNIKFYYEYAQILKNLGRYEESFKFLHYHLLLKNASVNEKKMWRNLVKQKN